jgi:hypothetical protein
MTTIDAATFPLCAYFFSGYLSRGEDATNFPPNQGVVLFERYENLLTLGLAALGLTKEALRSRSEFNFDSGDAANLESGMGILRTARALELKGFVNIAIVNPEAGKQGADLVCEKNGRRVCLEVKTITKQSRGRSGFFLEDQLYEKAREFATKAAAQLKTSAATLDCEIKIIAYVVNWFEQTIYLTDSEYQVIVNKLEEHGEVRSLDGIDGVWFIMKMGNDHLFLNENGKRIDN